MDVARRVGCSVQQIRLLENEGVLPPAARSASGYRALGPAHVEAALVYRALAAAVDPVEAKRIMRAARRPRAATLLALVDSAHARLHAERDGLRTAQRAAAEITGEPVDDARPADAMSIGELADALGVRPSTLRHWEAEGLLAPARPEGRRRSYAPTDVRDARIVHQLRRAGYRIGALQGLMPRLRRNRGWDDVAGALREREADLDTRSRRLLEAAAALHALLERSEAQAR
ncbi:MerR family transcriptional regulator [Streptomonospora wellingtoniae]|uniref:MerR family transcriptional regulator n=1 Tax=Streptomonospora wellingtoniae TaxID=3075544 RepID=A0ABU2KTC3_9ACTN|nr:MerR family transcriptional regulator [Streptomonospora sp. DSM 45055]MDT0302539.1 MerR family transcriptional regulator [Streptomonospora sp. DSM 45055]